jgi:hypothetical protein
MARKPFQTAGIRRQRREEMRRFHRENEIFRQERGILKKALAIFSRTRTMISQFIAENQKEYPVT